MNSKTIKHVLLGFLLALCTISLHLVLNKNQGLELTSLLLVIIGDNCVVATLVNSKRLSPTAVAKR